MILQLFFINVIELIKDIDMKIKNVLFGLVGMLLSLFVVGCDDVYAKSFYVTENGPVTGVFMGSSAAYTSLLSIEVNGFQDSPYLALNNHGALGSLINFGNHNAGDVIVFTLDVIDTGDRWYSDTSRNVDGQVHMGSYGSGVINIGFEDLYGGGDRDYNDMIATFYNISAVPEPETYMMLLIGLGLIAGSARYRSRS